MAVRRTLALAGLVAAVRARAEQYGPRALQDEVLLLPGAPAVDWKMFSGYIDVSGPGEQAGTRQMFYWFVESQSSPSEDPLVLWTNGGPGCSGLAGFLSENGPFRAVEGRRLEINPHSWNRVANMVFIEQPVGVGFSTTQVDIQYGDAQAAADNLRFIMGFRARYQLYASSDFYLSSESYGGHYLPTLAAAIDQSRQVPQFRGIFLGNPLTWMKYRNYGQYGTGWGHQLLPLPLWQAYQEKGCKDVSYSPDEVMTLYVFTLLANGSFPANGTALVDENGSFAANATAHMSGSFIANATSSIDTFLQCAHVTSEMNLVMDHLDLYALDFPKCLTPHAAGRQERWVLRQAIERAQAPRLAGEEGQPEPAPEYQPCAFEFVADYLNNADVKEAIGVAPDANWSLCSDDIHRRWNATDLFGDVTPVWRELIGMGKFRIMIYSGDDDAICSTLGTQEFIWGGLQLRPAARNWEPWLVDGQVAGFWTDFQAPGNGSFSFATVHAAGHMVPATQPARSLALLEEFLGVRAHPDILV